MLPNVTGGGCARQASQDPVQLGEVRAGPADIPVRANEQRQTGGLGGRRHDDPVRPTRDVGVADQDEPPATQRLVQPRAATERVVAMDRDMIVAWLGPTLQHYLTGSPDQLAGH